MPAGKAAGPQAQGVGEKQTIPARHGTATFVPKGHTIKIINTYGRQVVDTWAFALGAPPQDDDPDDQDDLAALQDDVVPKEEDGNRVQGDVAQNDGVPKEENESHVEDVAPKEENEGGMRDDAPPTGQNESAVQADTVTGDQNEGTVQVDAVPGDQNEGTAHADTALGDENKGVEEGEQAEEKNAEMKDADARNVEVEDAEKKDGEEQTSVTQGTTSENVDETVKVTESVTEKVDGDGQKRTWASYVPSLIRSKAGDEAQDRKEGGDESKSGEEKVEAPADASEAAKSTTDDVQKTANGTVKKSTWSSYVRSLPSVRSTRPKKLKEQRTWASYLPSGTGFSAYSTAKSSISAFMAQHQRDPTKSVAEQLYDFSKTPVGAAGLSAATGSGYAGSLYAAYRAYDQVEAAASAAPMEFMSMPHCHASTLHLSPRIGDTMVSNLRAPIMTMVEDTSSGIHDTLIAACDPQRYKELGVEKWEEHGSCAENLVFALKELNEKSGLKGRKAIGRDVTVNAVPSPLNLFMNIPWTQEGDVSFEAPKCKRGDFVKFRAERDLVVVMSACPQDVLSINGGKPMVAHFVVESGSEEDRKLAEEKDKEAQAIIEKAKLRTAGKLPEKEKTASKVTTKVAPKKATAAETPKAPTRPKPKAEVPKTSPATSAAKKQPATGAEKKMERSQSNQSAVPKIEKTQRTPSVPATKRPNGSNAPQPAKKKPRKLERRNTPTTTPTAKS